MGRCGVLILLIFSMLSAVTSPSQAASYPPPALPSALELITVHTTTLNITGPSSQNFSLNVKELDNISFITKLNLNTTYPITNFTIQFLQLNLIPPPIPQPSGKPLLVFLFNLNTVLYYNITMTSFYVKVPKLELQEFSILPGSVTIQEYTNLTSWYQPLQRLNNTDVDYNYYQVNTTRPALFTVTGIPAQASQVETLLPLMMTIIASSLLISRRRNTHHQTSHIHGRVSPGMNGD